MAKMPNLANVSRRIHDIYASWAVSHGASVALVDAGLAITYGELGPIVNAVAERLRDAGVRPGDRVLLIAENSVAHVVCILAISQLDAWSATVNARLSEREIDNFLSHSGARRAIYFGVVSPQATLHGLAHGARQLEVHVGDSAHSARNRAFPRSRIDSLGHSVEDSGIQGHL